MRTGKLLTKQELKRCKELRTRACKFDVLANQNEFCAAWDAYYETVHDLAVAKGLRSIKPQYWYDLYITGEIIAPNKDEREDHDVQLQGLGTD